MRNFTTRSKMFFKRNSSTILSGAAGLGVIVTVVLAIKNTPKAQERIERAEEEKGEELTVTETVITATPAYIPTIISGTATIVCIFGANVLNRRRQASLMSAYALLDNSFKEYRKKTEELYGEDAKDNIYKRIAEDNYDPEEVTVVDGDTLFYDMFSKRYFTSTIEAVQRAEYRINRHIVTREYAYLNEFYDEVGLDPIPGGESLGWSTCGNFAAYWQSWVDFDHTKTYIDDDLECYLIEMIQEPYANFEDFM